jgi:hypothetical protein
MVAQTVPILTSLVTNALQNSACLRIINCGATGDRFRECACKLLEGELLKRKGWPETVAKPVVNAQRLMSLLLSD